MDLKDFQEELSQICNIVSTDKDKKDSSRECTRFGEALEKFLKNETINFEEKVSGLTAALNSYSKIRPSFEQWDIPMNSLGHSIFMECARVILGMDLPHYKDDEEPKASFCTAIKDIFNTLKTYAVGQSFIVLQFLLANNWGHAVLVAMMNGDDVEEEKALAYLNSGEYPELFKLRIEMLLENGCDALAQNLCGWCVKSPVFSKDLFVWRTNLVLLQKLDKEDEFVNQCMDVSCCLAVQILDHWSDSSDEVIKAAHLGLSQSSLLQYWVQSEKECCTRPLLRHWAAAQEHENEDNTELQNSLQKLLQLAKLPETICTLVQVVMEQFGERFQEFCSMALVQCLRRGRQLLDSAKIKRDMREAEYAADGLARACRMLAVLYEEHPQMCLGSLLTAFYLEPERDLYREISMTIKSYRSAPNVEPLAPEGIDPELYHDVYELVQFLRPNTFALNSTWRDLRKLLINHMEEAGFVYLPRKNTFKKTEEAPPTVVREKKQKVNTKKKWKPVKFVDSGKSKDANIKTEEASTTETNDLNLNVSSAASTSTVASTVSSAVAVTSANLSYSCATYIDSVSAASNTPRITDQFGVRSMNNSTTQQWPTTTSTSSMIHSSTSMSYQQPLSVLTGLANTMSDHSYSSPNSRANSLKEHTVAAPLQNTVPTPLLKHNSSSMTAQQSMIVHSGTIPKTGTPQVMQRLPGTQVSASLVKHPQLAKQACVQKPGFPTQLNQLAQKPVTSANSQLHSMQSHTFQGQPMAYSQHQLVNSQGSQSEQPLLSPASLSASKTGITTVTVRQQLDRQNAVKKLKSKLQGNQQITQQTGAQVTCTLQPTSSLLSGSGQTNILINPAHTGTSVTYLTSGGTSQAFSSDGLNTLLVSGNPQQQVATNIASYVMPGTFTGQSTLDVTNIGLQIPQTYVNQSGVVTQPSQFSTLSVPSQPVQNSSVNVGASSNAYSTVPSSSENTIQQIANQVRQMGTLPVLSLDEVQQVLDCNTPTITSPPKSKTDVNAIKQIQYFLQSDNLPSPISSARIAPLKRNNSSSSVASQPGGKSLVPGNLYNVSQPNQTYTNSLSTGATQSLLKSQSATVLPHVHDNAVTASAGKRVQYALQQREIIIPGDVQPVGSSSKSAAVPQKAAQTMTMKYLDENNQVKSTTVLTKPAGTSYVQIAPCRTPSVQQVVQVAQVPQVTAQVGIPQPVQIQVQTQPQLQMQSFIAGQVLPPVTQQYVVQGSATQQLQQQIVNAGALQATVQVPGSQQLCTQQSLLQTPVASTATTQSSRPIILGNKSSKEPGKGQKVTPILPAASRGPSQQQQQQNQLVIPTAIPQSHQAFSYASPVSLPLNQNLPDLQLSLGNQMSLPASASALATNQNSDASTDQSQSVKLPTPVDCVNQFIDQVMKDAQLSQSLAGSVQNIAASAAAAAATAAPVMKSDNYQATTSQPTQQIENAHQGDAPQQLSAQSSMLALANFTNGVDEEKSKRGKSPKRTFTSPEKIGQLLDSVVERVSTGELAVSKRADSEDDDLTLEEKEMIFGEACHTESLSPNKVYTSDAKIDELLSNVVERLNLGALEPDYEELLKCRLRVADLKLTKEEKELIFGCEKTEDDQPSKVYTTPQELDHLLEDVRKASRMSLTVWNSDQVAELFNSVVERVSSGEVEMKSDKQPVSVETDLQKKAQEKTLNNEIVSPKDDRASSKAVDPPATQKVKEELSRDSEKPESTDESSSEEEEEVEVEVIVGPYFCKFCQAGFGTMAQRRRHQEWMCSRKTESEINPEDFKILSCDFCGRELNTMSGLKSHYSRYHPELKHLVQLPSQPPSSTTSKQKSLSSAGLGSREAKTEDQAQMLDRDTRKKSQWYGEYSSDDSFSEVDTDEEELIPVDATPGNVFDESKGDASVESSTETLVDRFSGKDSDQPYLPSIEDSESASTELYEATSMDSEPASPVKLNQRWRRCKSRIIMDSDDSLSTSSSDEDNYATRNAFRARSKSQDYEQMKKCFVRLRRLSATEVNAYTFDDEEKYANCLCAFCGEMFSGLQRLQTHLQEHLATSTTRKGETSLSLGSQPEDPARVDTSAITQKWRAAGIMPHKQSGGASGHPAFNHFSKKDARKNSPEQKKITFGNVDMYEARTRVCGGCGEKFQDISEFPDHMERCKYSPQYTETTQYQCMLCTSVVYKTMQACRHHVLFGCSGNPERKQPMQKSTESKDNSLFDMTTKAFGCGLCDSSFYTIDLLQNHAKSVHASTMAHFSTSSTTSRKKKKGQHKNTQKRSNIACQMSKLSSDQAKEKDETIPVKEEMCMSMKKDANSVPGSNAVVNRDAAIQSVLPKNSASLYDSKRIVCRYKDVQMYEVRCYKCKTCYQEFTCISAFRDHCGVTCNEPAQILWVNQCFFCDETFDQKSDCLKHMELVCQKATEQKTENVKQNELFCPFCQKSFYVKWVLQQHLLKAHHRSASEAIQISQKLFDGMPLDTTTTGATKSSDHHEDHTVQEALVTTKDATLTKDTEKHSKQDVGHPTASPASLDERNKLDEQESMKTPNTEEQNIPAKWDDRLRKTRAIRRADPLVLPSARTTKAVREKADIVSVPTLAELVSCTFLKHCTKKWEESKVQHFQCIYCGEEQRGLGGFHWHLVYSHASEYVASKEKSFRHNPLVVAPVVGSDNESGVEDDVISFKKTDERDLDALNKRWTLRNHEQQGHPVMLNAKPENDKSNSIEDSNQKKRKHSGDSMKNKAVSKMGNNSNEEEEMREHVGNASCQTGRRLLRKRQAISYEETYTSQDFAMSPVKNAGPNRVSTKIAKRDNDAQTSQNECMDHLLEESNPALQDGTSTVDSSNQDLNGNARAGSWSRSLKRWAPGNRKPLTSSPSWQGYLRKGRLGKKKDGCKPKASFRCLQSPVRHTMLDKSAKNLPDVQLAEELLPGENENASTLKTDSKLQQPELVSSTGEKIQVSRVKRTTRAKRDYDIQKSLTPQQKRQILTAKQTVLTDQRRRRKRKDVEGHRDIPNGDVDRGNGSNSFLGQVELVYTHIGTVADGIFDLSDLQGSDQLGFLSDGSSEVSVEKSFHHDISCNEPSEEAVALSQDVQVDTSCNTLEVQCQTGTDAISDCDEEDHSGSDPKNQSPVEDDETKKACKEDNPVEKDDPSKSSSSGNQMSTKMESDLDTSEEVTAMALESDGNPDQEALSGDVNPVVQSKTADETNDSEQLKKSSRSGDADMVETEFQEMPSPVSLNEGAKLCKNSSEASDSKGAASKLCLTASASEASLVESEVLTQEDETIEADRSDGSDVSELVGVESTMMETDVNSTSQLLDDQSDEVSTNSDLKECSAAASEVNSDGTVSDKIGGSSDFTNPLEGNALKSHPITSDSDGKLEISCQSMDPMKNTASSDEGPDKPAVTTDTEEKPLTDEQCAVGQELPVAVGCDNKSVPSCEELNILENTKNQVGSTFPDSATINQSDSDPEKVEKDPLLDEVSTTQQDHQEEESKKVETISKDVCMSGSSCNSKVVNVDEKSENGSCCKNSEDGSLKERTESGSLVVNQNQSHEMSCSTGDDEKSGSTDNSCATDKKSVELHSSEILEFRKYSTSSEVTTVSNTCAEKDKKLSLEFVSTSQDDSQHSTCLSEGRLVCSDNKLSIGQDDNNPADSGSSEEKEAREMICPDNGKTDHQLEMQELPNQLPEESITSTSVESPPAKESRAEEEISSVVLIQQGKSEKQKHKHRCDHCGNSFLQKSSLECHLRWVHHIDDSIGTIEVKKFKCPICRSRQEFDRSADLQCHMKWVHCISMFSWADAAVTEDDKVQVPRVQVVSPTECDVEEECPAVPFQPQADLVPRPEDMNVAVEADTISLPSITLKGETATTNICEEEISSTTSVDSSPTTEKSPKGTKKSHHKSAKTSLASLTYPWMCFFCEERFIKRFQLAEHMKKLHAPDPKFQLKINKIDDELHQEALFRPAKQHRWRCAPCRVAFPSVGEWTKHMKDIHGHSSLASSSDEAELFVDSRGREPSCPFTPLSGSERTSTVITIKTKPIATTESKYEAEDQAESSQQKLETPSMQMLVTDGTVHNKDSDTTSGDQHGPPSKEPSKQAGNHKSDKKGLPWMEKKLLKDYSRVHKLHAAAKRKLGSVKGASKKAKVRSSSRSIVPSKDVSSNVAKGSIVVSASRENPVTKDSCDKGTFSVPTTSEPRDTPSSCTPKSTESQTLVSTTERDSPPLCEAKGSSQAVATKLEKPSEELDKVTSPPSQESAEPENNCDQKVLRQSSRKRKPVQHAPIGEEQPAAKVARPCLDQEVASEPVTRRKEMAATACAKTETETVLRSTRRRTLSVDVSVRATRSRSCSAEPKPIIKADKFAKKVTSNRNLDKAKSTKKPASVLLKSKDGVIQTRSGRVTQQNVLVRNVLKKPRKPTISKSLAAKKSTPEIKRNCNKTRSLRSNSSVT